MELLTDEIKKTLPKLYSQDSNTDPVCVLKFFTPDADWTWYVVEGSEQQDGDWVFFGMVTSPMCPFGEMGCFTLLELMSVRGALGLPIERDLYWTPRPIRECK
jgi:hypothetical protein